MLICGLIRSVSVCSCGGSGVSVLRQCVSSSRIVTNSATGGQVGVWWVLVSASLEETFGFTNWAGLILLMLGVISAACGVLVCWAALGGSAWGRLRGRRTIPGPRRMPVIGSLLEMGGQAHRRLTEQPELAVLHKATKLMALSFGETRVVIASEPETAREILHSSAFADRPVKQSAQQQLLGRAIGLAPFADYWRGLHRIAATHMFAPKRIAAHGKARLVEVQHILAAISHDVAYHGVQLELLGAFPMLILLMLGVISAACGVLVCWAALGGSAWGRLRGRRTIPGPRRMPVIGSLLEMGGQAHRRLTEQPELAVLHKATKLMALSFGETRVVIASEPETAREILHSSAFADRPVKQSAQQQLLGRAIGLAPFADYWRGLHRIAANHMFAPKRIAAHGKARLVEVQHILAAISHDIAYHGVQLELLGAFPMLILLMLGVISAACGVLVCWAALGGSAWGRLRGRRTIPGPRRMPVIGSLLEMGGQAHRRLTEQPELAVLHKATKLMALSFGETRVVIASESETAREILHSSAFADRPVKQSAQQQLLGRATGLAPFADYWRGLHRIAANHTFAPKRIAAHGKARLVEVQHILAAISHDVAYHGVQLELLGAFPMLILLMLGVISAACGVLVCWAALGGSAWGRLRGRRTIPGPRRMPVIGSLLEMGGQAHRRLTEQPELAVLHKATKLMALSFGETRVVIASESETAREILHSSAFADRPVKQSAQQQLLGRATGLAPFADYWRGLHRIAANHTFAPKRIAAHGKARLVEVQHILAAISHDVAYHGVQLELLGAFPMLILLMLGVISAACGVLVCWAALGGSAWGRLRGRRTIPGPRRMPVIGSLLEMGGQAHRRLTEQPELAVLHKATKLMALSFGETRVVIASESETAREILHSSAFADRPVKQSAQQLLFGRAIGFAPFGDYWRDLRRIAANHTFAPKRIAAHGNARLVEVQHMLAAISHDVPSHGRVQVRDHLQRASLNNIMGGVFGRRYETGSPEAAELNTMGREEFELPGAFNWADHLHALKSLDAQRIHQRCAVLVPKVAAFVQRVIDEHRERRVDATESYKSDFVDALLGLSGDDMLADEDMVAVLWEMVFRGTDTTAILTEWIVAAMVLHPEIQRKVKQEVNVASEKGLSDESELARFPYLQAVMKETLRLHPPGSLRSGACRLSTQDVRVSGITAMVNMYAITHDPALWARPESFDPERYLEQGMDVRGNELRLASFSPGRALGLATVLLLVGCSMRRLARKMDPEDPDPLIIYKPRTIEAISWPPPVSAAGPRPGRLSYSPSRELDIDAHES